MESKSLEDKFQDVQAVIQKNPSACELKFSLFYSAILSQNPDLIKPYPQSYLREDNELRLDSLLQTASLVPEFQKIVETNSYKELPESVIEILHWIFVQVNHSSLGRIVQPDDYHPHLKKTLASKPTSQWPQYVFEVEPNLDSNAEKRFQQHKERMGGSSLFAFHGSKLESFFSILNFGLAQHLCKRDLYGDGAYLSTAMDVALSFSMKGTAWTKSHLFGEHYSALALCEYVSDPKHIQKNIPKSYVVLTNNEIVRLRYILIFTTKRRRPPLPHSHTKSDSRWTSATKIILGVSGYLIVLALVGYYNSGNYRQHLQWV